MPDLERALKALDEACPPPWRPAVGEHLIGIVRRYGLGRTRFGQVPTVIVEREGGQGSVSLWLSSVVLRSLFMREQPRVGERIGVSYQGKHPTKGYHRWALVVDRPGKAPAFPRPGGELKQRVHEPASSEAEALYGDEPRSVCRIVPEGEGGE
jgi:hypothetical protein